MSISSNSKPSYDYLTNLPLFSLTQEKIDELNNEFTEKSDELELYTNTTIQELWIAELDVLETAYTKWYKNFEDIMDLDNNKKDKSKKINKSTKNLKDVKDSKDVKDVKDSIDVKGKISIQTDEVKPKSKTNKK